MLGICIPMRSSYYTDLASGYKFQSKGREKFSERVRNFGYTPEKN